MFGFLVVDVGGVITHKAQIAATTGMVGVVKLLLQSHADPEIADDLQQVSLAILNALYTTDTHTLQTAIHHAAFAGRMEIVKLLVDAGANVNAVNHCGDTPLDIGKE